MVRAAILVCATFEGDAAMVIDSGISDTPLCSMNSLPHSGMGKCLMLRCKLMVAGLDTSELGERIGPVASQKKSAIGMPSSSVIPLRSSKIRASVVESILKPTTTTCFQGRAVMPSASMRSCASRNIVP